MREVLEPVALPAQGGVATIRGEHRNLDEEHAGGIVAVRPVGERCNRELGQQPARFLRAHRSEQVVAMGPLDLPREECPFELRKRRKIWLEVGIAPRRGKPRAHGQCRERTVELSRERPRDQLTARRQQCGQLSAHLVQIRQREGTQAHAPTVPFGVLSLARRV